jgi:hypothetical protein
MEIAMKTRAAIVFVALALAVVPARADTIVSTIPGADFSVPAVIGTFMYSLPADSVVTELVLFSPTYSFPPATDLFGLQLDFDGIGAGSLVLGPMDTEFCLGSGFTHILPFLTWDGSLDLSIGCWLGTCPSTYTRVSRDDSLIDWRLWIDFEPSSAEPVVPEPASLLLFGTGLVGLRVWRKRR